MHTALGCEVCEWIDEEPDSSAGSVGVGVAARFVRGDTESATTCKRPAVGVSGRVVVPKALGDAGFRVLVDQWLGHVAPRYTLE